MVEPEANLMNYSEVDEELESLIDGLVGQYTTEVESRDQWDGTTKTIFPIGESGLIEGTLEDLEFSSKIQAVSIANVYAICLERCAETVLRETDSDQAVVYDEISEKEIYSQPVDPDNIFSERARPLNVVHAVGRNLEGREMQMRRDAYLDELSQGLESLSETAIESLFDETFGELIRLQTNGRDVEKGLAEFTLGSRLGDVSDLTDGQSFNLVQSIETNPIPNFSHTLSSIYIDKRSQEMPSYLNIHS